MFRPILRTAMALALVLAFPASTLAASTSGTTSESFTLASTIAMTVPASVTYTVTAGVASGKVTLSGITTNSTSGFDVTGTFSDFETGGATIPASSRTLSVSDAPTGGILPSDLSYPVPANAADTPVILGHTGAVTNASATWKMSVPVSVPGIYTGTIAFVASSH